MQAEPSIGIGIFGVGVWVGVGVGVDVGLGDEFGDATGLGVVFGTADLIATPLFQTSFPFFLMQVNVLFVWVAFAFTFLHAAPAVIFWAEDADSGVKLTIKTKTKNLIRELVDEFLIARRRIEKLLLKRVS